MTTVNTQDTNSEFADVDSRNYFFFSDFSPHHELLSKMPLGPVSEENQLLIASIIDEIDKGVGAGKWMFESPIKQWGLQDVEIIYNGANSQRLPTRPKHSFAMGLLFPNDSVVPQGAVYITYSEPVPEEPVVGNQ